MIQSFKNKGTENIFNGQNTKEARKICPRSLWRTAARKLDQLDSVSNEAYMVRVPTHREPTHPGEMLIEEFLSPMGITQKELADAIHVPYQRINEIINQKRGVTPGTALRLAKFFGMSEDFWMNVQLRWDLYKARKSEENALKAIKTFRSPVSDKNDLPGGTLDRTP